MNPPRLSRRRVFSGALAATAFGGTAWPSPARQIATIRIPDTAPGAPISRLIYGSNEIGSMDGGALSADLDRQVGVAARRLGGNLMTSYNWVNNASNAGKGYQNANGSFLLDALEIPASQSYRPARVIAAMHEASSAMDAASLVTLPIAGYVAADFFGAVAASEAAPSPRFVPVRWDSKARAKDPIDRSVCDIPQLLSRLVETYGGAASAKGIHAYALDNEPGLWSQNHPRIVGAPPTIRGFIARSILAARVVKSIDPAAQVFGPASWGATEFVNFQNARDWDEYRDYGSFLAAYLDAFREASERDGRRLLDALDVHWYAFHRRGDLFRNELRDLDAPSLDAPRSLDEAGFREDSWVARALPEGGAIALPILPSLRRLIERWFPGTAMAVTEFNYGGAGRLASGLALADALGRMGRNGVGFAAHWGSLAGWLGEAYRLYRAEDAARRAFCDRAFAIQADSGADISAFAAGASDAPGLSLVVINKAEAPAAVDVGFAGRPPRAPLAAFGFDAAHTTAVDLPSGASVVEGAVRLELPARSARRYTFA